MSNLGDRVKETAEGKRLFSERSVKQNRWRTWGPYLSERQWGTVREDYSSTGQAWEYFSHDQARSRAYRWGEDGLAGISDNHQILCFAFAFWNKQDSILKERLFGLTGNEGNHGEDVKEVYHYVDNTPTHSYMKYIYRYPQMGYPYQALIDENRRRNRDQPEFELIDTGAFDQDRYFDIQIEYAKQDIDDIYIKVTVNNRAQTDAEIVVLPTLWFRNIWSWKLKDKTKPSIVRQSDGSMKASSSERQFGDMFLYAKDADDILFCENETNLERFQWGSNFGVPKKDGINNYIVNNAGATRVGHDQGTKAAYQFNLVVPAGKSKSIQLRLCKTEQKAPLEKLESVLDSRITEADAYYDEIFADKGLVDDEKKIVRQAYAGMLWSKQFFHYVVEDWLEGDPAPPLPPPARKNGRNSRWTTLYNEDIISMPDKWEYPWFATWDLAFHTVTFATIDPDFAKYQLRLFTCEWYMHPNGQLPAYEWNFDDVNPPLHAWAAWRVFQLERDCYGEADFNFLTRVHSKLLMYFTWWTNRKDSEGNNLFEGGFLGLDNISALDRSHLDLAGNVILEQSDGTTWMGIFCLNMLQISIELAQTNQDGVRGTVFSDLAYKFFQHFLLIAKAFNTLDLWNDDDGFYYDVLKVPRNTVAGDTWGLPDPVKFPMKLRSMVGLLPIAAVETISLDLVTADFQDRVQWFIDNREDLTKNDNIHIDMNEKTIHLSLVSPTRLKRILDRMLDPEEFLSNYGLRSISKAHAWNRQPYRLEMALRTNSGEEIRPCVEYCPAESNTALFGGNSNWRGPIWFPVNIIILDALRKQGEHYRDTCTVEFPKGSGTQANLISIADEVSQRLIAIFMRKDGCRPVFGGSAKYQTDPNWMDHILFYEYFHGDNGAGIGASHQTGWTGQVVNLILKL
jgi:hypothetical protein